MSGEIQRNENGFEASAPPEGRTAPVNIWIKPEIEIIPADEAEASTGFILADSGIYS